MRGCKRTLSSQMSLFLACLALRLLNYCSSGLVLLCWAIVSQGEIVMNIRTVVRAHLMRERVDVLIAVLAPLVLMLESGYACGWVFANGELSLNNPNTYLALGRGIFLEGLIFAM